MCVLCVSGASIHAWGPLIGIFHGNRSFIQSSRLECKLSASVSKSSCSPEGPNRAKVLERADRSTCFDAIVCPVTKLRHLRGLSADARFGAGGRDQQS